MKFPLSQSIFILISSTLLIPILKAQHLITGPWTGELKVQGMNLAVEFEIKDMGEQLYRSYLSVPLQGAKDIPMDVTEIKKKKIHIESHTLGAEFNGVWDKKNQIQGEFKQNGKTFELNLIRGGALLNRPQTPKPPFPYLSRNIQFSNNDGNCRFHGTLTSPKKENKRGTIIMFTGSGAQNRDEEILGHKPFLILADTFTRLGFNVLRVDDRGAGFTQCHPDAYHYTSNDLIKDGNAYLKFVRDSVKNHGPIILFGHSEGVRIIAGLAVQNPEIKGLLGFGPVLCPGSDINTFQNKIAVSKILDDTMSIHHFLRLQTSVLRLSENKPQFNESKDSFKQAFERCYAFWLKSTPPKIKKNIEKQFAKSTKQYFFQYSLDAYYGLFSNQWMYYFLNDDPLIDWLRINQNTLLLNGSLDQQTPVSLNKPVYEKFLSNRSHIEFKILPEINHLFQKAKTGDVTEYGQIEESIHGSVMDAMVQFLNKYP